MEASGPATAAPIACTLSPGDVSGRVAQWQAVLASARSRVTIDDGVRVEFAPNASAGELAQLAAAEQACCAFFRFGITIDERGLALEVRAPADAQEIVLALFGAPD